MTSPKGSYSTGRCASGATPGKAQVDRHLTVLAAGKSAGGETTRRGSAVASSSWNTDQMLFTSNRAASASHPSRWPWWAWLPSYELVQVASMIWFAPHLAQPSYLSSSEAPRRFGMTFS